jgi:hypothetical protein
MSWRPSVLRAITFDSKSDKNNYVALDTRLSQRGCWWSGPPCPRVNSFRHLGLTARERIGLLTAAAYRGGEPPPPPPNFEVLTRLSRISSSVEYKFITTISEYGFIHLQIEWNPLTRGYCLQIPILSALCPQLNLLTPREKNPGYATGWQWRWKAPLSPQTLVTVNLLIQRSLSGNFSILLNYKYLTFRTLLARCFCLCLSCWWFPSSVVMFVWPKHVHNV